MFWRAIDERKISLEVNFNISWGAKFFISWRIMVFYNGRIPCLCKTSFIIQDEWVRMISKGLHNHLQIYDMVQ